MPGNRCRVALFAAYTTQRKARWSCLVQLGPDQCEERVGTEAGELVTLQHPGLAADCRI